MTQPKDVDCLSLANNDEFKKWMNPLMQKGYSFNFIKGAVLGYVGKINIGCECVEIDEFFPFSWEEKPTNK